MKTDIIGEVEMQMDTVVVKKPHRPPLPPLPPRDSTSVDDTSRIQIGFNPSVEDWEGTDVERRSTSAKTANIINNQTQVLWN